MIRAITPYNTNFGSRQKVMQKGAQQVARKVVNLKDASLKGISKSPIRLKDDSNLNGVIVGAAASTVACCVANCLSDSSVGFSEGFSIGAGMV